ncbi:hypothetical protein AADZ91_15170 [Colwelliaceae bacterium 6441]
MNKLSLKFWLIRAIKIYCSVAIILLIVELIKDHTLINAIYFALFWSFITTSVFIATILYHLSKGRHCQLCQGSLDVNKK